MKRQIIQINDKKCNGCGCIEFITQKALEKAGKSLDMKRSIITIQGQINQGAVT